MVGSHKILTVSYGTFSCTLEGFDDAFGTMKAIAEYFRDLAADDRYFGATPPTPDAEMLARIAEREIARRVEARMGSSGLVLRAAGPIAEAPPPPRPPVEARFEPGPVGTPETPEAATAGEPDAPTGAEPLPEVAREPAPAMPPPVHVAAQAPPMPPPPDGDGVAARLERIRAVVGRAALDGDEDEGDRAPAANESVPPGAREDAGETEVPPLPEAAPEPEPQRPRVVRMHRADLERALGAAGALAAAEQAEDEDAGFAVAGPDSEAPISDAPATAAAPEGEPVAETDAPEDAGFEGAGDESVEDFPPVIRPAPVGALSPEDEADLQAELAALEAEIGPAMPEAPAPQPELEATAAEAPVAGAAVEEAPAPQVSAPEESAPDAPSSPVAEAAGAAVAALVAAGAAAAASALRDRAGEAPAADDRTAVALDLAMDSAVPAPVAALDSVDDEAPLADPAEAPAPGTPAPDATQAVGALLASLGLPHGRAETPDPEAPEAEAAPAAERAAERVAERVKDDEPTLLWTDEPDDADEPEARENLFAADTVIDAEVVAETPAAPAPVAAPAEAARPVSAHPVSAHPVLGLAPEADEAGLSRILSRTDAAAADPAAQRRREAIAQLKAAVAATEAARRLGEPAPASRPEERGEAFRDDLRQAVRPRRPLPVSAARAERPRPAPLKLVASQRVDLAREPQPVVPSPVQPVRPRRVTLDQIAAEAPRSAPERAETAARAAGSFAAFAAEMGATSLTDILEAAAVYASVVEGAEDFSRPQIIEKVREASAQDFSREDGLRSFGILLRTGRITRVRGGRFAVAGDSRFHPDRRAG
jgi:hypothetical protein